MPDFRDEIRARLAPLRLDPATEDEIAEELAQHLTDRYDELRALGRDDTTARATALAELSDHERLARELRGVVSPAHAALTPGVGGKGRLLEQFWLDVRYSLRSFRRQPAYAAIAVLTFAIGIGACTLIFSAVHGVIQRPLPFPHPEQLVTFWGTAPEKGLPEVNLPPGLVSVLHDKTRTLTKLGAYGGEGMTLTGEKLGDPERIEGASVSIDFFHALAVAPVRGRVFVAGDAQRDAAPTVVILSHSLWQRKFAGDSGIVGQPITLNANPTTVVGIMPAGFDFPGRAEFWVPQDIDPANFNCWCFDMVGRARPGLTAEDVRREMMTLTDDFGMARRNIFPDAKRGGSRFVAMSLAERVVGDLKRPLVVLLGAVGLVLLIACANIANLVLVRTGARSQELAVRCCLGASPRRVAAQLLTESLLLSLAGALAGTLLAAWGANLMRQLPERQFPRMSEVHLDPMVLAFTAGLSVLTGLLCGLAPALRVSRVDLQDAIKTGTRGSATAHHRRLSDGFVVTQFALSLVLLVGAGLLLRSYRHLTQLDLGYRPENVVVGRISLPWPKYDTSTVVRNLYGQLVERVRVLPGVEAVGTASNVPLGRGNNQNNVFAEGQDPRPGEPVLVANVRIVSNDYFRAIGTPLLEGRVFTSDDNERNLRVGVVDEAFAKHFWPKQSAIGKRVRFGGDTGSTRWITVVGVVRNIKHNSLDEKPDLQIYESFNRFATWGNYIVVRSTSAPETIAAGIREQLRALDPTLPLYQVRTMNDAVRASLGLRRLVNVLLGGFALTALLLATIGIYGVISLSVTGRVREFGIRLALGAQRGDVRRLVLRHGLVLAGIGVVIGLAGAVYLTRFLQKLLFGVQAVDWPTFAAVAVLLALTALAASYLPARRATRADPVTALRVE